MSNAIVDDICCTTRCTRSSLNVDTAERGRVGGLLYWVQHGFPTYCQSREDGVPTPYLHKEIVLNNLGAKFILVVEKHTVFHQLIVNKFYDDHPCIILSGMGVPGMGIRTFLKLLWDTLRLPVYGLFDCDPSGISIFAKYTVGSYKKAYDSVNLTCPSMTWLGVWGIPSQDLSQIDMDSIDSLLKTDHVKENRKMVKELKLMKKTRKGANLEALDELGEKYLSKNFLPSKLTAHKQH